MLTAPIQKLSPVTKKREGQRCHNTATVAITLLDACHEVVINHKTGRHLAEVQQGILTMICYFTATVKDIYLAAITLT